MKPFLFEIITELKKNDVDFVVCGGVACVLQGCERTTFDVDLNILFERSNIEKAIAVFRKLKYLPRIPEPFESLLDENKRTEWIQDKSAVVYTVLSAEGQVQANIFLWYSIEYGELKKNADLFAVDGFDIFVSSKSDLIRAKEAVVPVREKDIYDMKILRNLLGDKEK
jgi:hypothetical protein